MEGHFITKNECRHASFVTREISRKCVQKMEQKSLSLSLSFKALQSVELLMQTCLQNPPYSWGWDLQLSTGPVNRYLRAACERAVTCSTLMLLPLGLSSLSFLNKQPSLNSFWVLFVNGVIRWWVFSKFHLILSLHGCYRLGSVALQGTQPFCWTY